MPRRPWSSLVATLVVGLLVTGCSSADDESSPSSSPTPSGSTSRSPSAKTDAPPPAPRAAPGPVGQKAFARHVMDLWGYALRTNDSRPLTKLGGKKACGGCSALGQELARRKKQAWVVDFTGLRVRTVTLQKQSGPEHVARSTVDIPQSDSYNADGTFRNTSPPHAGSTFVVRMRYADKHYRLVSFTVS